MGRVGLEKFRFGVTHHVFTGGLPGQLIEQGVSEFEPFYQAGIDLLGSNGGFDIVYQRYCTPFAVEPVGPAAHTPGQTLAPACSLGSSGGAARWTTMCSLVGSIMIGI